MYTFFTWVIDQEYSHQHLSDLHPLRPLWGTAPTQIQIINHECAQKHSAIHRLTHVNHPDWPWSFQGDTDTITFL